MTARKGMAPTHFLSLHTGPGIGERITTSERNDEGMASTLILLHAIIGRRLSDRA